MPKALYIHIPFCTNICAYCDFTKVMTGTFSHSEYLDALLKDIDSQNIPDFSLETIYIGGGTPTALTITEMTRLLSYLKQHFGSLKEFTVEANPDSLNEEMLLALMKYGVNRISLGAQCCDDETLAFMNRSHRMKDLHDAIDLLKKHQFENYNLDFIYGYPGISQSAIDRCLDLIKDSGARHISYYSLQIEPGTVFYNNKVKGSADDEMRQQYDYICKSLSDLGIKRYEVSNFSVPGFESKHNLTYWHDEEYYAAGVSASGYIGTTRFTNTKSVTNYIKGINRQEIDPLDEEDMELEFLMLNLRLVSGFEINTFNSRFHKDFLSDYHKQIERVKEYIQIKDGYFMIREDYIYTMDSILQNLIS